MLDEPTIGLHQRDNDRLIKTLTELRDMGNTIIVVEHDEDTIFASDYIVDIGPRAGVHGGKVVVAGYLEELLMSKTNSSKSLTLSYLRGEAEIKVPKKKRDGNGAFIQIKNGNIFNIKNLNVKVPLGKFNVITGSQDLENLVLCMRFYIKIFLLDLSENIELQKYIIVTR